SRRTECATGPPSEVPRRSDRRSAVRRIDLAIGIGGAAGQGIATPGDILARIFVRRGLHVNAYNAYQSIIRGGHIFLTLRTSEQPVLSHGDKIDVLMPVNQDTMPRRISRPSRSRCPTPANGWRSSRATRPWPWAARPPACAFTVLIP